ncbi:deoxyinosine 3'endonuclease (endonuclease V) [Streptomyces sp. V3I8]|nr:deoxyinosine 3'endonuclease (endonuclease V) [Streptomyces sp. V3I8]
MTEGTVTTVRIPVDWPATEERALAVQDGLRGRVVLDEPGPAPGTGRVTGVDVAYDDERDVVVAAAVVLDAATLDVVAESTAVGRVPFPYVPGLLAFRELPAVLAALEALPCAPGLVVCDGYGLAHPRRFGLASHLGVLTGLPTIGVAKNPFTFTHEEPDAARFLRTAARGRGGGRPRAAHPGGDQTGVRLGRPPGDPGHRLRPHPPPRAALPPARDDPARRRAVPPGAAGDDGMSAF